MRVALIHAVTVAMQPVEHAFERLWPEVERVNLLDDSLSVDRARSQDLTPEISRRIADLAHYGRELGADAILFTCSAFGEAIEAVARQATWPVLKPNEAMFEAALEHGRSIGMLATFRPSVASMEQEFMDLVRTRALPARIRILCVPEAMDALRKGDAGTHNALLVQAAEGLAGCDAIMLAQFSTSVAADAIQARVTVPVLTSPDSAVIKLRRELEG